MGQSLVIVESPSKAKTIGKYLGKKYIVEASMGHIRDLPKSQLGVDKDNNYLPKYITIRGKGELVNALKKKAKKCDGVLLATDPDREGEAISWHLAKVLNIDEDKKCRIAFNEITKNAIKKAIKSPRKININLVNAQQARRVLDRLVGYEISPILWKKVKYGLSAGRVQSVALRIICDREKEIDEFVPKEYWSIECRLYKDKEDSCFNVKLISFNNKKIEIENKKQCDDISDELKKGTFEVSNIKSSKKVKNPLPPFTTSTLQQDAYKKLNFSTRRTMSVAQQLYEGAEVKGHGSIGLITYMRTDSMRVSTEAKLASKEFIVKNYGKDFAPENFRVFKSKKNIQDAHEAIRPTYIELTPEAVKGSLKPEQYKLYNLIWRRFIASQMSSAIINVKSIDIKNGKYSLRTTHSTVGFEGFMKIYDYSLPEETDDSKVPELGLGDRLNLKSIDGKQHFTQPPAHFSEGSLVKTLEEYGIGRPSTYAPIISTLISRRYVERTKKVLIPTDLGKIVNDIVCKNFKQIVDIKFTAEMEDKLDSIEEGNEDWTIVVDKFYKPLEKSIEIAEKEVSKVSIEDKVTDVICEKCGRNMVIKHGRFGDFLACPGYPECKNTKPIVHKINVKCPKCGGDVLIKHSKKGRKFYGCSNYPKCDFVSWYEPVNEKCPKCGSIMVKKYNKAGGNFIQCSNSDCKFKKEADKKQK